MKCPHSGTLRALLDDELSRSLRAQVESHLDTCAGCRERVETLARQSRLAAEHLGAVGSTPPDLSRAMSETKTRISLSGETRAHQRRSQVIGKMSLKWRRALAGTAVVLVMVGLLSYAPTQALAKEFLSIFRVRQVVAVQIEPAAIDEEQLENLVNALRIEPEVVIDEDAITVPDIEAARARAGFDVKMPRYLPGEDETTFSVKEYTEIRIPFTRQGLELLLQTAGMDPSALSDDIEDGEIVGSFPAAVQIERGDYQVIQMLEPQIEYPEGVDLSLVAEATLRLLGLPAEDAARVAETTNWATTLLLPIPTNAAQFSQSTVAGGPGIALTPIGEFGADLEGDGANPTLVWQRDDTMYAVSGPASTETLVRMAESLF